MRRAYLPPNALGLLAATLFLTACGGGSSSTAIIPVSAAVSASSVSQPTPKTISSVVDLIPADDRLVESLGTAVTLKCNHGAPLHGPCAQSAAIPASSGYSGTILLPSGSGTISITSSTTNLSSALTLGATPRLYVTVTAQTAVNLNGIPGFAFDVPVNLGGKLLIARQSGGWTQIAGPVAVANSKAAFAPASGSIKLAVRQSAWFALYGGAVPTASPSPSPTPKASSTPTPTPTPDPTPTPTPAPSPTPHSPNFSWFELSSPAGFEITSLQTSITVPPTSPPFGFISLWPGLDNNEANTAGNDYLHQPLLQWGGLCALPTLPQYASWLAEAFYYSQSQGNAGQHGGCNGGNAISVLPGDTLTETIALTGTIWNQNITDARTGQSSTYSYSAASVGNESPDRVNFAVEIWNTFGFNNAVPAVTFTNTSVTATTPFATCALTPYVFPTSNSTTGQNTTSVPVVSNGGDTCSYATITVYPVSQFIQPSSLERARFPYHHP